jgi:hypothetical protein
MERPTGSSLGRAALRIIQKHAIRLKVVLTGRRRAHFFEPTTFLKVDEQGRFPPRRKTSVVVLSRVIAG